MYEFDHFFGYFLRSFSFSNVVIFDSKSSGKNLLDEKCLSYSIYSIVNKVFRVSVNKICNFNKIFYIRYR